jgi:hypothetical protein
MRTAGLIIKASPIFGSFKKPKLSESPVNPGTSPWEEALCPLAFRLFFLTLFFPFFILLPIKEEILFKNVR